MKATRKEKLNFERVLKQNICNMFIWGFETETMRVNWKERWEEVFASRYKIYMLCTTNEKENSPEGNLKQGAEFWFRVASA